MFERVSERIKNKRLHCYLLLLDYILKKNIFVFLIFIYILQRHRRYVLQNAMF